VYWEWSLFRYFYFFRLFNVVESAGNKAYFVVFCSIFNIVSSGGSEGFCIFNNIMELYIIFT
jgi:hypothetical protein